MVVFVVVLQRDSGVVAGVFSTLAKASSYMEQHPYSSHAIIERTIDDLVE